jgi:5-(carboxyamino)imidazole ribonucleotide synthase
LIFSGKKQVSAYLCYMDTDWSGLHARIGLLGGGQLGRMIIQKAIDWDLDIHVLDPDSQAPCFDLCAHFTVGSLNDFHTVLAFGEDKDILTVEMENVNIEALEELEKKGVRIYPQPRVLKTIRDKGLQKEFYRLHGIPTAPFKLFNSIDVQDIAQHLPCVQKLRTGGYDGKGVQILRTEADLERAFSEPSVVEEWIPFEKEISVIVSRNVKGENSVYPAVECEFNPEANLVEFLFSPAEIKPEIEKKAQDIALGIIDDLQMVGLLAVEFFLTKDQELLVNEIAPRPHNSGHHTIECNATSQFEQFLRAILNLPFGDTRTTHTGAMINLLGAEGQEGDVQYVGLENLLSVDGVYPHIYGKRKTKPYRKMGHITLTADSLNELKSKAEKIKNMISVQGKTN